MPTVLYLYRDSIFLYPTLIVRLQWSAILCPPMTPAPAPAPATFTSAARARARARARAHCPQLVSPLTVSLLKHLSF
eukprot:758543-Hanusia_phi.AAC.2